MRWRVGRGPCSLRTLSVARGPGTVPVSSFSSSLVESRGLQEALLGVRLGLCL